MRNFITSSFFILFFTQAICQTTRYSSYSQLKNFKFTYELIDDSTYHYSYRKTGLLLNTKEGSKKNNAPVVAPSPDIYGRYEIVENKIKFYKGSRNREQAHQNNRRYTTLKKEFILDTVSNRIIDPKKRLDWTNDVKDSKMNMEIELTNQQTNVVSFFYFPATRSKDNKKYNYGFMTKTCYNSFSIKHAVSYFDFLIGLKAYDFNSILKKTHEKISQSNQDKKGNIVIELQNQSTTSRKKSLQVTYDLEKQLIVEIKGEKKNRKYIFLYGKCDNIISINYLKKDKLLNTYQLKGYL